MRHLSARLPAGRATKVVGFVLGKPPGSGTIFPAVFDDLWRRGFEPQLHLPHDAGDGMPVWLATAALAVHRGLRPASRAALGDLERAGLTCVNSVASVGIVENRAVLVERLAAVGLPVPPTECVATWAEVVDRCRSSPAVVKRMDARIGRGAGVAIVGRGGSAAKPPFTGPYIVQEAVETDGIDRKLYVAGRSVQGLLKRWPRGDPSSDRPFDPEPALANLARSVGQLLDLEIFGVDVVIGRSGPKIVDVNAFPGFRGVPRAASVLAEHLAWRASATGGAGRPN